MATRRLSITLPQDVADGVRDRVASGEYGSEDAVVRESLRALADREKAEVAEFEASVKEQYAQWEAGTLESISFEDYLAELAADRAAGR